MLSPKISSAKINESNLRVASKKSTKTHQNKKHESNEAITAIKTQLIKQWRHFQRLKCNTEMVGF